MKTILLFAGYNYYPGGGDADLIGVIPDRQDETILKVLAQRQTRFDWASVIEIENGQVTGKFRWNVGLAPGDTDGCLYPLETF